MDAIVIDSVRKCFRQRLSFWPWSGRKANSEITALAELSLQIPAGKVQVLLGPNGSGKTTLLKLVSTMLLPDSGSLVVAGFDTRSSARAVRSHVGFAVANERSFYPRLTARENLEFFAVLDEVPRRERRPRINDLLKAVGLGAHAEKLVMNCSAGMYQRLGLARALLKKPSVLLLDEPSRSLDPASTMELWNLIGALAGEGTTVLIASHNFQEAISVADHIAIVSQGRLRGECGILDVPTTEALRRFYFDCVSAGNEDRNAPSEIDTAVALAG